MVRKSPSVVVAMSGGVDSSAAAVALAEEGYKVIAVTFRMWEEDRAYDAAGPAARCSPAAVEEAAAVARLLDVEHAVIDLRERFQALIVEPFALQYLRGRTPNPCVECNRLLKFPTLVEVAEELGADVVATGHYARTCLDEAGDHSLLRARDRSKDQSYVLYGMGREHLSRCLFPNGDSSKSEVRKKALARGFDGMEGGESQEICFLCGESYGDFISRRYPEALSPGPILDTAGEKLGEHRGIAFHTVGQRHGLGISAPHPMYVVALDASRRAVIVGKRDEVPGTWLRADLPHWVKGEPPADAFAAEVMARYNTTPEPCRVELCEGGFELTCGSRVWALTPGQHAVLYRGDEVLGGGVIASVG